MSSENHAFQVRAQEQSVEESAATKGSESRVRIFAGMILYANLSIARVVVDHTSIRKPMRAILQRLTNVVALNMKSSKIGP